MKNITNFILVCLVFYCNASEVRKFKKITTGVNELFTPDDPFVGLSYTYKYFPAAETGDPYNGCFTFKFYGTNDLHVALTQYAETNLPPTQVIIGGWNNQISKFRIKGQDGPEFKTPNAIKQNVYNTFWIKWSTTSIEVGRDNETVPFMSHQGNNLNPVLFIGIYTCCGASGKWIFKEPNCPNFQNTLIENKGIGFINEKILKQGNFMKQIENQISNFKKVTRNPTMNFVEFYINELLDNYKKCKLLNEEILTYPSDTIKDYVNGHVYGKIQNLFYTFLDTLYNQKQLLASKNLLLSYPALETEYATVISKSSDLEYQYYKLNNQTCVTFKVMALNNIHLTLSNAGSTEKWEIFIGGWFNTKSGLAINSELVVESDTPSILSINEFKSFQLEWSENFFKLIDKSGEAEILTYISTKKLYFNKVGLPNLNAVWIFDESPCSSEIDIRID